MLILTRKVREAVRIDGPATITVVGIDGGRIKLGIDAAPEVCVVRAELAERGPGERLPSIARRVETGSRP